MNSIPAPVDSRTQPLLREGRRSIALPERSLRSDATRTRKESAIWVVSTVHRPDDARIFWKQALTLAAAGYSVTAIFWTADASASSDIEIEGVHRRILWKGRGKPGLRQKLSVLLRTLRLCLQSDCESFLIHDPELIPVGMALVSAGRKVIYDAHEDLPTQILHKDYLTPWQKSIARGIAIGLVRSANRWLSGQLCATSTVQQRFQRHSCVVRNFPLLREFTVPANGSRTAQIVYVGGLTSSRGITELIEAVNRLHSSPRLILAGPWESESYRAQCEQADSLGRVTYAGILNRDGIAKLLAESDVGVAVLHPLPAYVDALPVKLFEYMAAGLPVVVSDFPLWRGIVGSASCGVLVEPGDVNALRVALDYLLESPEIRRRMGVNGRWAVEHRYTWETESTRFLSFVDSVFGSPIPSEPSESLVLPA